MTRDKLAKWMDGFTPEENVEFVVIAVGPGIALNTSADVEDTYSFIKDAVVTSYHALTHGD